MNAEARVLEIKQETPDVKSVKLELKEKLEYKPGQYMLVELDIDDPENSRPLSIASSPTEGFLMFSTKISGSAFKQKVNALKPGDKVKIQAPNGVFILDESATEVVLLGGGIGITPFRSMVKYAADNKLATKIVLLYSNRTPDNICYNDQWPGFERENQNFRVVHTITDLVTGWNGRTGRIDENLVKESCSSINNALFYICGPPGMVEGLSQLLKAMDVPPKNVRIEKFEGY